MKKIILIIGLNCMIAMNSFGQFDFIISKVVGKGTELIEKLATTDVKGLRETIRLSRELFELIDQTACYQSTFNDAVKVNDQFGGCLVDYNLDKLLLEYQLSFNYADVVLSMGLKLLNSEEEFNTGELNGHLKDAIDMIENSMANMQQYVEKTRNIRFKFMENRKQATDYTESYYFQPDNI